MEFMLKWTNNVKNQGKTLCSSCVAYMKHWVTLLNNLSNKNWDESRFNVKNSIKNIILKKSLQWASDGVISGFWPTKASVSNWAALAMMPTTVLWSSNSGHKEWITLHLNYIAIYDPGHSNGFMYAFALWPVKIKQKLP